MLSTLLKHLRAQYLGAIALFVALGGTTYAATTLSAGSVGNKQLRNGAVTANKLANGSVSNPKLAKGSVSAAKLDPKTIAGSVRAYVQISAQGQITAAHPAAKLIAWIPAGPQHGGTIQWSQPIRSSCFAMATTAADGEASYASALLAGGTKQDALTYVLQSTAGQPVNVAIMCPQP
jgi:hypothetical protein